MEKTTAYRIKNALHLTMKMIRYNMRIIFAARFIWFLLASLGFFIFILVNSVLNNASIDEELIYNSLIFPGILLIFYPMTFGIQNDQDAGILEIIFGIPDYRYKVWLVRMLLVFILVFIIIYLFSALGSVLMLRFNLLEMTVQTMFPIVFLGSLSFMFSTIIKNGNGTAVIMVILGVMLFILSSNLENSQWNIFLNPFKIPRNLNEVIWEGITVKNRIFLSISTVVFLLTGLLNLQKRERFV